MNNDWSLVLFVQSQLLRNFNKQKTQKQLHFNNFYISALEAYSKIKHDFSTDTQS